MKILVLGSGGREHALAWKISRSPQSPEVICAPGNGGMAREFTCLEIPEGLGTEGGIQRALAIAKEHVVDLTVVGPELPLSLGIVDTFEAAGCKVFGPTKAAAQLEASKCFAKEFMDRHEIPTAAFRCFTEASEARKFVERLRLPVVVKADGLADGKGVIVARERHEVFTAISDMLVQKRFGAAGERIVIEDYLPGAEMSLLVLTDGVTYLPLETARDHKAARDGDRGPNTGGMGSYSPYRSLDDPVLGAVMDQIVSPTLAGLQEDKLLFKGLLYFGLMLTKDGPQVLEYNVRFGDPETQSILMRLQSDFLELLLAVAEGRLQEATAEWDPRPAVCIVAASGGYPGTYPMDLPISGVEEAIAAAGDEDALKIFFAGTKAGKQVGADGIPELLTAGGRVLGVTARGNDLRAARQTAYGCIEMLKFDRMYFRRDIGLTAGGVATSGLVS